MLHRGRFGAMTFFESVREFGRLKGTCCGGLGYVSCRREKSGFGHDGGAGKSHAGEGKVAFGMTGTAPLRLVAHVKKEKARNDVCGAAQAIRKPPRRTRQKEKSKK